MGGSPGGGTRGRGLHQGVVERPPLPGGFGSPLPVYLQRSPEGREHLADGSDGEIVLREGQARGETLLSGEPPGIEKEARPHVLGAGAGEDALHVGGGAALLQEVGGVRGKLIR